VLDVLELEGHSAMGYTDGFTAIAAVEKSPPDVVLTDMIMPGIDGLETYHRMKQIVPCLPAIVMSGFALEERRGQITQEGILGFVRKPVNFEELFALLNRVNGQTSV